MNLEEVSKIELNSNEKLIVKVKGEIPRRKLELLAKGLQGFFGGDSVALFNTNENLDLDFIKVSKNSNTDEWGRNASRPL